VETERLVLLGRRELQTPAAVVVVVVKLGRPFMQAAQAAPASSSSSTHWVLLRS
jgi:hypothetical protein